VERLAFAGTIVVAGYAGGWESEVNVTSIIWTWGHDPRYILF